MSTQSLIGKAYVTSVIGWFNLRCDECGWYISVEDDGLMGPALDRLIQHRDVEHETFDQPIPYEPVPAPAAPRAVTHTTSSTVVDTRPWYRTIPAGIWLSVIFIGVIFAFVGTVKIIVSRDDAGTMHGPTVGTCINQMVPGVEYTTSELCPAIVPTTIPTMAPAR